MDAEFAQPTLDLRQLNQSLIASEQRLRLALETGRIGLWVWNSTDVSNAGDWSPRLKEIFGLPPGTEVTHDLFLKCVHPEDRERVNAAVLAAISGANGGAYELEYRAIHADESVHWVTARGQAFFNPDGTPFRFIGTVMDITERKSAEEASLRQNQELERRVAERTAELAQANEALRREIAERKCAQAALKRSEDDLRIAIDTIPGLVWTSRPDGHIEYLNQRWLDYTGLTLAQATGWGWQTAVHPQDLPGLMEYWNSILTAGQPGEYEARLRRFDAEYRWFLFRGVPLLDAGGRLVKWYGTNTDIEDRRVSEHVARGQLEALTQTLDALARESEPEKFLDHVLRRIERQLRAHSLGVWEINPVTGRVELAATFEDDQVRLTTAEAPPTPSPFPAPLEEHPVWTEFFRDGRRAVLGALTSDPLRVRFADAPEAAWYDWRGTTVANPSVPVMRKRLADAGVVASLAVPMSVAGKVTGLISIRFREARTFCREEVDLARALAHQATLAIRLVRLSRQSREAAVLGERNRLARDIHDTLAQGLTGVIVQLEAAEDAQAQGLAADAFAHVARASELAREGLREARRSVHALRPRALEEANLCTALQALFEKMSAGTGLQAEFHTEGRLRALPAEVEENLLRVGQEVFTNVLRHAQARHFTAWLLFDRDTLRLEFCDDGRGFEPTRKGDGFGLIGMEERVQAMGGVLSIQSVPEVGTAISIVLALPDAASSPPI